MNNRDPDSEAPIRDRGLGELAGFNMFIFGTPYVRLGERVEILTGNPCAAWTGISGHMLHLPFSAYGAALRAAIRTLPKTTPAAGSRSRGAGALARPVGESETTDSLDGLPMARDRGGEGDEKHGKACNFLYSFYLSTLRLTRCCSEEEHRRWGCRRRTSECHGKSRSAASRNTQRPTPSKLPVTEPRALSRKICGN